MKKFLAIALAAIVVLGCFAACGNKVTDGNATGGNVASFAGELSTVIPALYEKQSVEFAVIAEGMAVDLTDAFAVKGYLGLGDGETASDVGVKEAFFSESMMGAQAYSLVVARVADASKTEEIKKAMFEGINTAKWICVMANELRVVSSGDVIMLVMASTELAPGVCDGMVEAFKAVVGETSGEVLSKNETI